MSETQPAIVSYPGRRSAIKVAKARSLSDGEPWAVIRQLDSPPWHTAISVSLLRDTQVTAGCPYSTVAIFEAGQQVPA